MGILDKLKKEISGKYFEYRSSRRDGTGSYGVYHVSGYNRDNVALIDKSYIFTLEYDRGDIKLLKNPEEDFEGLSEHYFWDEDPDPLEILVYKEFGEETRSLDQILIEDSEYYEYLTYHGVPWGELYGNLSVEVPESKFQEVEKIYTDYQQKLKEYGKF